MNMLVFVYLHHRAFWDGSDGLEGVSHLFQTTRNVFLKQDGEMGPFCLPFALVNPASNVPEEDGVIIYCCIDLIRIRNSVFVFGNNADCSYSVFRDFIYNKYFTIICI